MHGQDQEGEVGNQQEEGAAGQSGQVGAAEARRTEASGQGGAAQEGSVLQMEDVSVQTVQALEDKGRILISGGAEASAMAGNLTGGAPVAARLMVGDGTVIVMAACAEGGYTAGTNDAVAVVDAVLTPEQIKHVNEGETIEVRVDIRDISVYVKTGYSSVRAVSYLPYILGNMLLYLTGGHSGSGHSSGCDCDSEKKKEATKA